jgi:hypothetical protein
MPPLPRPSNVRLTAATSNRLTYAMCRCDLRQTVRSFDDGEPSFHAHRELAFDGADDLTGACGRSGEGQSGGRSGFNLFLQSGATVEVFACSPGSSNLAAIGRVLPSRNGYPPDGPEIDEEPSDRSMGRPHRQQHARDLRSSHRFTRATTSRQIGRSKRPSPSGSVAGPG